MCVFFCITLTHTRPGCIGAGKSTLATSFVTMDTRRRVCALNEGVGSALKRAFYENPKTNAFGMDLCQAADREARLRYYASHATKPSSDADDAACRHRTLVIDRSIVGSLAFAARSWAHEWLSDAQYAAIVERLGAQRPSVVINTIVGDTYMRPIIVWLRAPAERCLKNTRARGDVDANALDDQAMHEITAAHALSMLELASATERAYTVVVLDWDDYAHQDAVTVRRTINERSLYTPPVATLTSIMRQCVARIDDERIRHRICRCFYETM